MARDSKQDDLLETARETARASKALAKRLQGTARRDVLVLEALALDCLIKRCERTDSAPDFAELEDQIGRLLRLAADPSARDTPDGDAAD